MKIRQGFVSNSSSTSFLVAWDKRVTKLADVRKHIPNYREAKLLWGWMKEQEGLLLCAPPKAECGVCKERFRCYTGGGKVTELARLISTGGWEKDIEQEEENNLNVWELEKATRFFEANKGRVAYIFRIADYGEGASSDTEANMRNGEVFDGAVPYEAWL